MITAEYIWLDGSESMPQLRSKTRMVQEKNRLPEWGFDGGSTYQADIHDSDLVLKPVYTYHDPFRPEGILVMCEVMNQDGTPHTTNFRHPLKETLNEVLTSNNPSGGDMLFGFEQEYTLMDYNGKPLAFGQGVNHTEQGAFYCGVGAYKVYLRNLADNHLQACLKAGIGMYGINAEVMPGQWEFQTSPQNALKSSDDLWVARYILDRLSEDEFAVVSYHPKPAQHWNGAGCHTNFSTAGMRDSWNFIELAIKRLEGRHDLHMNVYGAWNDLRMTGECETSDPTVFSVGTTDRSCSIRIPHGVNEARKGYLEDRRPAANIDPYRVCDRLMKSVCLNKD